MAKPAAPPERVLLVEEELVVERGQRLVTWLVEHNDGWLRAPSFPGARVEKLDRGAGVVWRTRVELELALGTRLVRVEVRPDHRRASTVEHLTQNQRTQAKVTRRTEHRVGQGGKLYST